MANVEAEKTSYSSFERFLYIFLIPFIFLVILTGVLLSFFGYDVMNSALKAANSIPILNKVIPDPKPTSANTSENSALAGTDKMTKEEVVKLKNAFTDKEAELKKLTDSSRQKDQTIKELQAKIDQLQQDLQTKKQSAEEYDQQIKSLANIYAKMNPSKAAPILENLTLPELVLVLGQMNEQDRVNVMEKMDPKIAADASIQLKDIVPVKDREIAALQARLDLSKTAGGQTAKIDVQQLAQTFAGMTPKNAAVVLLEMLPVNETKVLSILGSLDTPTRSKILGAISDISRTDAAKIVLKLGQ
ncbi:hypothetical protein [Ferviditalea candida]|uniref:Magnesium transporter MgtE intracellular domain-containing protein n=1 Tax=Ferviditalea candida TaxID=3108399 RepID=A0ABU5ZH24_9BACL|nr:hypothetical protein [Paenibacillaceae bacterium T2]